MSDELQHKKAPRGVTRRDVLHSLGAALSMMPFARVASGGVTASAASTVRWASGGTASMSGDYPDPFTEALGAACALTCATMRGPCYAETLERKDISEGYPGLPLRLAFLVVDRSCKPIEGASVDVWHTRNSGLYSGGDTIAFCTSGDADARARRYFRGVQTTDADGRVDFDTCFPGWYGRRAVHIHLTVRLGGQEHLTAQLFFPDDLTARIFAEHPEYREFGQPEMSNSTDPVYTAERELATALQPDGALLAWKVLVLRSSLEEPICGDTDEPPIPPGAGGGPPGG